MTIGKLFQKDKKDSDRKSVAERESEAKRTQSNVDIPYRDGWNWNLCNVFFSTFFIKSLLSFAFYLFAVYNIFILQQQKITFSRGEGGGDG